MSADNQFCVINAAGDKLFQVRGGVDPLDALEQASCLMASALAGADVVASDLSGKDADRFYGVVHLMEAAEAALDAALLTLNSQVGRDSRASE